MKQGNIIPIEVPEKFNNPHGFEVDEDNNISFFHITEHGRELEILKGDNGYIELPEGYTFICTNRDATEEQKTKLCYVKDFAGRGLFHVFGKYYPTEVTTQLHKSWTSLLKSLGADQGTKALLKKD
jgi:hypothetical protein